MFEFNDDGNLVIDFHYFNKITQEDLFFAKIGNCEIYDTLIKSIEINNKYDTLLSIDDNFNGFYFEVRNWQPKNKSSIDISVTETKYPDPYLKNIHKENTKIIIGKTFLLLTGNNVSEMCFSFSTNDFKFKSRQSANNYIKDYINDLLLPDKGENNE